MKINGEMHYLWRHADHDGEVLESVATPTHDKAAALTFTKNPMNRHGRTALPPVFHPARTRASASVTLDGAV